ncbi:MAG: hypothetical protein GY790_00280 [Bacteroidetes bacterium]|nr:hypothetical protein [Bacteroidota bacterium]
MISIARLQINTKTLFISVACFLFASCEQENDSVESRIISGSDNTFKLTEGEPVRIVVAFSSNFKSENCLAAVKKRLASFDKKEAEDIENSHEKWWQEYWSMSYVDINDDPIEKHYYLSNYNLASFSRDPDFPPSIFGTCVTGERPAWNGDYHLNYNHMAPYYGLYSSNHIQQADPYNAPILEMTERGKFYSKKITGIEEGIMLPVGIGPLGIETTRENRWMREFTTYKQRDLSEAGGLFFNQKSNSSYCVVNMAMQFYHTYDQEYIKRVYPFVKGVATFWENYLQFESGRYVIYSDAIHEGSGENVNPILTLGLVRLVMQTAIDMSKELDADTDHTKKWQHVLDHLSGYNYQEREGKKVFRYTEEGAAWWENNTLGIQHIYPGGQIGLDSDPELLMVAHNTIDVMQRWLDGNGSNSFFPAAVRVGYDPDTILAQLQLYVAHTFPNGYQLDNPHGIENLSTVPNTINEMLCMGHGGVLRVFPVWPKGKDASFHSLRTHGAFLVSSELKEGVVQYVKIVSERGRDCTMENPWPGRSVSLSGSSKREQVLNGDRLKFGTGEGEIVILRVRTSEPVRFYVSLNGSDSDNGSLEQPFATLEAAKIAVREYGKNEINSTTPVEVIIRGGVYHLKKTLELKPEDSGTKNAPVTWRAAENERVVLSGGRAIDGKWKKDSDGKTWYVDLPEAKGWVRDLTQPEAYQQNPDGPWHFRQLYVDGKRATRARFPNADEQNSFLYAIDGSMEHIKLSDGEVKASWGDESDAQINIVSNWRFFNQWNDITDVDTEESVIFFGPRERHGKIIEGNWFLIEGVKSELDQPGEWYLDTEEGQLFYMPEPGQDPNNQEIIAPCLNRIVYLKGEVENGTHVEYVNFKGLEFRNTTFTLGQIEARVHTDGAVMFENVLNCRIEKCHFENIGGYALWLHLDCKNNVFHVNTVINSGGGGVLLTGSRLSYMDDSKIYTPGEAAAKVAPYLTDITHNTVKHCGQIRYYGGGVHIDSRPASMAMMPGNYIAHNHFQDLSRNGIFTFRNQGGNVVEFNEIHDCMQTTIDGACIHFASMNRFNAPNFVLNNYLYDIWGYEQKPDGKPIRHPWANGVFLDWATSHTTVKNNFIYNTGEEAVKFIMGNWNLDIENNLSSETRIEPPLLNEMGPEGTASNRIYPRQLKNTGGVIKSSDKAFVQYSGLWEQTSVSGMAGLFKYRHKQASPEKGAQCTYNLQVVESGTYKICLMYFPDEKNASNATITVKHSEGEDVVKWNFRQGDRLGFAVEIGAYPLVKDKPASVTISNRDSDGFIVADGVGFIKISE